MRERKIEDFQKALDSLREAQGELVNSAHYLSIATDNYTPQVETILILRDNLRAIGRTLEAVAKQLSNLETPNK